MISLIMSCVTTTSISILINGSKTQYFTPTRGIRQRDPLSPYLFIMCMELFLRNISLSIDYLNWKPIRLSNKGPLLSHLFFADDIILFSKITPKSCNAIIDVLNNFCKYSGQKINFENQNFSSLSIVALLIKNLLLLLLTLRNVLLLASTWDFLCSRLDLKC